MVTEVEEGRKLVKNVFLGGEMGGFITISY